MIPVGIPDLQQEQFMMDRINFLKIHAIPLGIAWIILIPLSMITARFGSRWNRWFPVHIILNVLALVLTVLGTTVGIQRSEGRHFLGNHRKLGIAVLAGILFQTTLGIIISYLYNATRVKPPVIDKIHWWLGRCLVLLAFVTIDIGILWMALDVSILIAIIIAQFVLTMIYCFLLIFLP